MIGTEPVVDVLHHLAANLTHLTMRVRLSHWNYVGDNFASVHEMLGKFYVELDEWLDSIAEDIRTVRYFVNEKALVEKADFVFFGPMSTDGHTLLKTVLESYEATCTSALEARESCDGFPHIQNHIDELVALLTKHMWFLRSVLN